MASVPNTPATDLSSSFPRAAFSDAAVESVPAVSDALVCALTKHATDAIVIRDCSGKTVFANRAASSLNGKDGGSIIGCTIRDLYINRSEADMIDVNDRQAMSDPVPRRTEETVTLPNGVRTFASTRTPWLNECGEIAGVVCVSADITERKRLEGLLAQYEAHIDKMVAAGIADARALSGQLESAWEEDKRALAGRLHDEIGSALTALNMHIAILRRQMTNASEFTERFAQIKNLLDAVTNSIRSMQSDLRPGNLDAFGIKIALADKALEFERNTGITCRVDFPDEVLSYPPHIDLALLRLLQDALDIVGGQGNAMRVDAVLDDQEENIVFTVRAIGLKFADCESYPDIARGLHRIRERAARFGGSVMIRTESGRGTDFIVTLPKKFCNVTT
jgi:PAS domain S-box-containing protein